MKLIKRKVIVDLETKRYYTGRGWGESWTRNEENAEFFEDEQEIIKELDSDDEYNYLKEALSKIEYFEIRDIYWID